MINLDWIILTVQQIVKRYGTRDPFLICTELGVLVKYIDFTKQKGLYLKFGRNRYIYIKDDLPLIWKTIICLHELGHDQLHWKLAGDAKHKDDVIFKLKHPIELEANYFTAEMKFKDSDILDLAYEGYTNDQIAMKTGTCTDLVSIKVELLKHKGHGLRSSEFDSNCLKTAEVGYDGTDYMPY